MIDALLELAQGSPDGATFERHALAALTRRIGADVGFFAVAGEPPMTAGVDATALARAVEARSFEAEMRVLKEAAVAKRGVVVDTTELGEARVRRCGYYRAFAAPVGGRHSMLAFLRTRGHFFGALMLGRTGSTFTGTEVADVERLLPALAIARASFGVSTSGPLAPASSPRDVSLTSLLEVVRGERTLARVPSGDGHIVVRDKDGYREMVSRGLDGELVWTRARIDEPSRSGWFYVDLFALAAVSASRRSRALFLGCGGGVAMRQLARTFPGVAIDIVDPSRDVIDLARRFYSLDAIPRVATHIADGAAFVASAASEGEGARWDVVVVDAFDGRELPSTFTTEAFFRDLRRVLTKGGAAAMNVVGTLGGQSDVQAAERALRRSFADVRLVPVLDPGEAFSPFALRNVVLLARA